MEASPEPKIDFLNLFTGNIFKSVYPIIRVWFACVSDFIFRFVMSLESTDMPTR